MFKYRSEKKEILDLTDLPQVDLYRNLRELDLINRYLGGHRISVNGLKEVLKNRNFKKIIHIADIGCGGGDSLRAFAHWSFIKDVPIRLTGIDLKQDCINFCIEHSVQYPEINFIQNDYKSVFEAAHGVDIVHAALFLSLIHISEPTRPY